MAEVVENVPHSAVTALFEPKDIVSILTLNDRMLIRHVEAWKDRRTDSAIISDNDIFLRRGLSLDRPRDVNEYWREWDFINSYSVALSVPEQFALINANRIPALVSGELGLFEGRILFFSPFVPGMQVGQLEAGVIPADAPIEISFQGEHGGILEYVLGERPEHVIPDSALE